MRIALLQSKRPGVWRLFPFKCSRSVEQRVCGAFVRFFPSSLLKMDASFGAFAFPRYNKRTGKGPFFFMTEMVLQCVWRISPRSGQDKNQEGPFSKEIFFCSLARIRVGTRHPLGLEDCSSHGFIPLSFLLIFVFRWFYRDMTMDDIPLVLFC